MKQGELEAKKILERKGIVFDETYYDDNSANSMPDFKYFGQQRYLEVTHTFHNNEIAKGPNRFNRKSIADQLKIMKKASDAYERIRNASYPDTEEGKAQYKSDLKLMKSHYGFDPTKLHFPEQYSEFNCDCPTIECAPENIIREVLSKGKTHNSGNTDLFIFVLEDEFEAMMYILRSGKQNGCYGAFFRPILLSPFQVVYVCQWNFEAQTYEIDDPLIMKFEKTDDGGVTARRI